MTYLKDGMISEDRKEVKQLIYQTANYALIDSVLFKRGFNFLYICCLRLSERRKLLEDLHDGICNNHAKGLSLYIKALGLGYYRSIMKANTKDLL